MMDFFSNFSKKDANSIVLRDRRNFFLRSSSFIGQDDSYSCGPIAIYNSLLAFGYDDIPSLGYLRVLCQTSTHTGTKSRNFKRVLHQYFVFSEIDDKKCVLEKLDKYPIIVDYDIKDRNHGHYSLIFKNKNGRLYAVNRSNRDLRRITSYKLDNMLDRMTKAFCLIKLKEPFRDRH